MTPVFKRLGVAVLVTAAVILGFTTNGHAQNFGNYGGVQPVISRPGSGVANFQQFDRIMMQTLRQYNIPGGALSIARGGQLLYANGYGFADAQARRPFTADTIFCLASCSKSVTAAAVLHLVDQGRVRLDDTLYDVLGRPPLPRRPADPRVYQMTVRQLLHHACGWNTDSVGFRPKLLKQATRNGPVPFEQFVLMAMCEPLDYGPGTEAHYSNWQYGVLKLVVEHASGRKYAEYIQNEVLRPMGINGMSMERPSGHYAPGEALRYDSKNGQAFPGGHQSGPIRREHLAGGWRQ
jgi:CubicO group peptidase (beta-lactamase class C family)